MLVEALISMVVFAIVFTALGWAMQQSVIATRQSKDLQSATQLVNQRLEQARAIASDTLMAGAQTSHVAANIASGVEARTSGSNPYTFNGETLLTSTSPPSGTPLNPYRVTQTVNGLNVTLSTYVTRCYQTLANPGGCQAAPSSTPTTDKALARITVVGSWTILGTNTVRTVTNQSLAFSPTSCLSTSTHPFSAPCQAFMYAGANAVGGLLSVQGYDPAAPSGPASLLGSASVNSLDVRLPDATTSLQVEQVGRVKAVAAGASILENDAIVSGGSTQTALSTNDPAQTTTPVSQTLSAAAITRPVAVANGLTVTATGAGAAGTAVAAMRSTGSPVCQSAAGSTQSTGYPGCASASITPSGATSLALSGTLDGVNLATTLGSVAAPASTSRSHVGSYLAANAGSVCAAATSAGCVVGDLRSLSGAVVLGGLPSGMTAPSGWLGGAVLVDAVQDDATAERGVGAATAATPTVTGTSPMLKVWTGSGYQSIPLTTTTAHTTWTVPAVSVNASGVTVELRTPPGPDGLPPTDAGTVSLGDRVATATGPTNCSTTCALTGSVGTLTVNLNYEIKRGSTSLGRFIVNVTLFDQEARATLEPSPAAAS